MDSQDSIVGIVIDNRPGSLRGSYPGRWKMSDPIHTAEKTRFNCLWIDHLKDVKTPRASLDILGAILLLNGVFTRQLNS
jgi:hypothetical protein